jgi:ankyrin repeat protein
VYCTTATGCQPNYILQIYNTCCSANNKTALHDAAKSDSVDIIKLLLDKGMSVNLANADDSTPLHDSAAFGHLAATKTFVERGSAINTHKHGNTPLILAERKG